ncbi:MAG: GNAT family N-acetyltransferase [Actinobacteria bacterium]|nr:GNAT family N-acetyltransferase [Actinomycetota bacterium]
MLRLARRGDLHSVFHLWRGGELAEWYVNLERPLRRTPLGFDHLDRELDLLARPDGTWEWLDEDEFEASQALGVIDPVEAGEIRAEGERVVAAWPFPTGWEGWRPDPAWPLPALPAGWDEVVWPVLRTARLELRPLDESDLPWYAALRADPRFSRKSTWRESEESLGRKLSHWAVHGFGGFAVPGDGVIALGYTGSGFEGIEPHEVDLGWFVRAERWGQGIATEAARAVLEFARREEIGPLVVRMAPGSAASRRVAEKLGFVRDGDGRARNGDAVEVYRALS